MEHDLEEASWPLTELGFTQAGLAGEWLRATLGRAFDAVYASPFVRTLQTADALDIEPRWQPDARVRERAWGDYVGQSDPPYSVDDYLADLSVCSRLDWRSPFPGGESILDMRPRVEAFVDERFTQHVGGRVVVVTHGGTMRTFQTVLEGTPTHPNRCVERHLDNACVLMYRLSPGADGGWDGEVRTAHPAQHGMPDSGWAPIHSCIDR